LWTVAAWNPSGDERLMLEKVQMPPSLLLGVVSGALRLAAGRTQKPAAFGEIEHNGQLAL